MNPALDKTAEVERVVPEDKLRCKSPRFDAGGGGINVARAVTTLGGEAAALFPAGGWSGERLTELLEEEGVPNRQIRISNDTRENLIICETETCQQFRFGMPGAELAPDDVEQILDALAEMEPAPEFLVLSGSLPSGVEKDFYRKVAAPGGKRGSKVIVDTHGDALRQTLDAHPFLIKPNIRELGQLAGEKMESDAQIEATARKLLDEGAFDVCVVSLGAGGAMWVSKEGTHRLRAPTVHIRSKVGAGDCTIAGFVLALSRGWAEREVLAFGVAAGAAAVTTPGTELCRRGDVERLYETLQDEAAESKHGQGDDS